MDINKIFGRKGQTRRERKEAKRREMDRMKEKAEIMRMRAMYNNRQARQNALKKMEKLPSFQKDFNKMKQILEPQKPMKFMLNPAAKDSQFFKSTTQTELKGFDKTFKKKGGFFLL